MKIYFKTITKLFLGLFAAMWMFTACEEKDELPEALRLFRPVIKNELEAGGNWITANWQPIKDAVSYKVEISQDTSKTILNTITVDSTSATFEELEWDKLYQVQIQALAENPEKNSKMSDLGGIKTPKFPSILQTPSISDVSDAEIKVSWVNSGATVTSIKVLNPTDKTLIREVTLSDTDVANQYRIISRLTASTSYLVELYSGTTLRGYETYTTKAALEGTLVDLRGIEDRPSVLADTIPDVPSGSTIILQRGLTYTISSSISLDKSITILSGTNLLEPTPAVIFFTSNFNFVAGSVIDKIEFKEVTLRSDAYGSRYLFNTTNGATIGTISLESVKAEIFRGLVRLQSGATTVDNFTVNNSVLDSISGYGVLTVDNVSCKVNNIAITNTTIYKAEKVITSKQNSTSVVIENCTINEAPFGNNYLVDYSTSGTNNVTNGIKIANCIFGIGKSNAGNRSVRGYRANANTSTDVSNTYTTTDYVAAGNAFPNTSAYSKTSFDLFQDPKNGNFQIKDSSFSGRNSAGDPRWRP